MIESSVVGRLCKLDQGEGGVEILHESMPGRQLIDVCGFVVSTSIQYNLVSPSDRARYPRPQFLSALVGRRIHSNG